jgi:hypothetical protein
MSTAFRLVGYDKTSERMAVQHEIPYQHSAAAKDVAGLGSVADADLGNCELDPSQADFIGMLIHDSVDTYSFDYFLEPYVVAQAD